MLKLFDLTDFAGDYISALATARGVDENTFLEMMVQEHLIMSVSQLDMKAKHSDLDYDEMRLLTVLDEFDHRYMAETAEFQGEDDVIRLHS